jgi:hypothetical protein
MKSQQQREGDPDVIETGHSTNAWKGTVPVVLLAIGGIGGYVVGNVSSGPDVSEAGQESYACALAAEVREDHRSEDDWGDLGEDRAYNEFFAVRALLGRMVPQRDDEGDRFAELDWNVYSDGPSAAWGELLDDVIDACENG